MVKDLQKIYGWEIVSGAYSRNTLQGLAPENLDGSQTHLYKYELGRRGASEAYELLLPPPIAEQPGLPSSCVSGA